MAAARLTSPSLGLRGSRSDDAADRDTAIADCEASLLRARKAEEGLRGAEAVGREEVEGGGGPGRRWTRGKRLEGAVKRRG